MTIDEILQRNPRDPLVNQGQARIVDKRDDRALAELQGELKTFVCEGQYADGIARIVESFLKNLGHTSQQAAWVSGFFGSGKSHLLKMLAHLWADTRFPDGSTARSLVPAMPDDLRSIFRELDTAGKRTGGLVAGAGSLPSGSTDVVRQTVLGILLRGLGLPELYPQAQFCLWLQEQGHFEAVKADVAGAGKQWDSELNNLYVSGVLARAVLAADSKFAGSEIEARKTIREQFPKRDTDITTGEFLTMAKRALRLVGRDGRLPCTVLILDEAQQYIGDSNERSVTFTELSEAVSKQLDSHVMLVAAGQSALTSVPLLQKLMDRFTIRVALSDTDVEAVTRKVLLQKKATAVPAVQEQLGAHAGEISRQLHGTRIAETAADRHVIVDDYPLLPVRRRFWEHCFRQIDAAGTSSQLRSQLRIIHDAVAKIADRPLGVLVPGDELFDALAPEMVNTGVLLREINEKIIGLSKDWKSGDPLARRICGLVFLIGRLPREAGADIGVRPTKEHLSDLLVDDLRADNGKLRSDVEATLERLVADGVLMRVDDEFRLQTREGSEWEREFRNRHTKLANDDPTLQIKRDQFLYAEFDRIIRTQRIVHGAAKEARLFLVYRDAIPPGVTGEGIPLWVRDGWAAAEKDILDAARSAGADNPILYVFIPRASAEDLRKWLIEAAAAEDTLGFKGIPTTDEGREARRSMESRRDLATRRRDDLVREIVGNAKVFQGGGSELLQATLETKLREGAEASLIRLFPRFKEADSVAWPAVIKRAREGADQPFASVGHTGPVEQHPVCHEVLLQIGAGKTGADLRKQLRAAPYGWPQDAVDAALITLHRLQHVSATLNGATVAVAQLDQNKISKAEFRVERVTLSVTDRLAIRKLFQMLGVTCKTGEELVKVSDFLNRLVELAQATGGDPPLPAGASTTAIDDIRAQLGNEQLAALRANADELEKQIGAWTKMKSLVMARKPAWLVIERLAQHAVMLPAAFDLLAQMAAIREQRLLLATTDPVPPIRSALTVVLRKATGDAHIAHEHAYTAGIVSLDASPVWQAVSTADRGRILMGVGLTPPAPPDLSSDVSLLGALDNTPLGARQAEADAVPGRVQKALEQAARLVEPKVRTIAVERATLATSDDVSGWIQRQQTLLLEAIKSGPVLVS